MTDCEKLAQRVKELEHERQKRKEAEKALLESQQRYERLVSTVPCAIYDYIRYPDGRSQFVYISSQCKNIFEYNADQIIENNDLLWSMVFSEDVERLKRDDYEANQARKLFQSEVRINLPSGGIKWIELTSMPSAQNVHSQAIWSGVILDITERKKMESKILKIKKLEATAILAGGIAHDFNNLLAVIIGYIDLTMGDLGMNHRNADDLNEALKASRKAQELTQKFITFSSGGTPVKRRLSIKELITESVDIVLARADHPAELSLEENLWQVEVDAGQMNQVFKNVLSNAKESMADGGAIQIHAENISSLIDESIGAATVTDRPFVKIVISDQGEGIPPQIVQNIFDPYFSTKERGAQKGMGLGLTVALSIVQQHDGHMVVTSEEKVGTSVCLYLPVAACP